MRSTIAILGGGFGGLACARALAGGDHHVVLIDRRNYHLFQPLLYQVATAALSAADITSPLRHVLSRHHNVEVRMGNITGVDLQTRQVLIQDQPPVKWDRLVLATGAAYSWFGHDAWASVAPALKTLADARTIRARLLGAFERAEIEPDPERQGDITTCVIVGGGPTGVEMAGALADMVHHTLPRDFRRFDPTTTRIVLAECADRILPAFSPDTSAKVQAKLEEMGVEIRLGHPVEEIDGEGV
ncbi:MAG: FAD-dependent oxidoreductase, partial [Zoogloea sp.]|nr:FAD-dependent oxidoreductase [Zoogloea sp.]